MKKRSLYLIFLMLLINSIILAQTFPDTLWTKTFGGSSGDTAYSVQQTIDGGYIIAGYTYSFGSAASSDFWLVKTDENGNEEWNQTYDFGLENDEAYSVQQTVDEGYIIAGYAYTDGPDPWDFWLVKTDENGIEEWNQTYGGSNEDVAYSVQQTTDGGYIIAGYTYSYGAGYKDFWLVKTDANGNEEWNQTYGGIDEDVANSVQQTIDGGYIIAGYTRSFGAEYCDYWLIKTDENGNEEWNHTYSEGNSEEAQSVQQTTDEGYIIAGFTANPDGTDFWLIKTDENGNEEWNQTYGGNDLDVAYSVWQTIDGGYIIAGYIKYNASWDYDFYLVKTDGSGNEEWEQTYGGSDWDKAYSVQQTTDGGYIIAGYTWSYGPGCADFWLIRLGSEVSEEDNTISKFSNSNLSNYPDPFNPTTTIYFTTDCMGNTEIIIYNIKGQKVKTLINENLEAGIHQIVWNGKDDKNRDVPSGIYLYKLETDEYSEVKKAILLK